MSFHVASGSDEMEIRRLLRQNPLGGRYSISIEREPNGLGGVGWFGERKVIVLARDEVSGDAVGMCERVVRLAFVDGRQCWLPYLSALRINRAYRNRIAVLRGGFQAIHQYAVRSDELPFALTSITSDNSPARRVLTAGVAGLPRYEYVGNYTTLIFKSRPGRWPQAISMACDGDLPELANTLQTDQRRYQFAPVWTEEALRYIGVANILVHRREGRVTGCVAFWDQSSFKQTIVRGYPPALRVARRLFNMSVPLHGKPRLPKIGKSLSLGYLSCLAVEHDRLDICNQLLTAALDLAHQRGIGAAALGLDSRHDWIVGLKRFCSAITYDTELHLVHSGVASSLHGLDLCPLTMPDVGLM